MKNINRSLTLALLAVCAALLSLTPAASAQIWDADDFLISGYISGTVAVYDQNLSFKGFLDPNFSQVTGLDLTGSGNLVAASYEQEVREYSPFGDLVSNFSHENLGYPLDVKWQPPQTSPIPGGGSDETLLVGTMIPDLAIQQFDFSGECVRSVGSGEIIGLTRLPRDMVMAGGFGPNLELYSLSSGALVATIPFDSGQLSAVSMFYSSQTGTVLMSDWATSKVYERGVDGQFIRSFEHPNLEAPVGVTRGPGRMVYVADHESHRIFRFTHTGQFVDAVLVAPLVNRPTGIVWAGNGVKRGMRPGQAEVVRGR